MGLDRFLVWIQLSIASLSYEYPSVRNKCPEENTEVTCANSNNCRKELIFPYLKQ